jgi:hypothetical protein
MIRNSVLYILGVLMLLVTFPVPLQAITTCQNGIDDDGDTLADYPADPGCASASDGDETDGVPPGTVTNVIATPGACGTAKINLSWDATTDVQEYVPNDDTHSTGYGTVLPPSRTFLHTGLIPGDWYGYSIKAHNAYGSTYSADAWAQAPSPCTGSDLQSFWVELFEGSLRSGEVQKFRGKLNNGGDTAVTSEFSNEFTYQWDTDTGVWQTISGGTFTHPSLGAHAHTYDIVHFTPDRTGTLYIQHCVDSELDIDEGVNETPNCSVESFTVTEASCVGTGWHMAANEGDSFIVPTPTLIRYQATEDSWVEGTYSGIIECTNDFFGSDPQVGEMKYCFTEGSPIVSHCELSNALHGDTNGACEFGYAGSCESSCNDGAWVPVTNTCTLPLVDDFEVCTPDDVTCAGEGDTFIVDVNTPLKVVWGTNDGDYCGAVSGTDFETGDAVSGKDAITSSMVASTSERFQVACNYQGGIPDDAWVDVVTLQQLPTLTSDATTVREGGQVELSWDTNNGDETTCTLSGGNIDGVATLGNGSGDTETGTETVTIGGRSTFIITCGSLSAVKTIEIVPSGWEG